MAQGGSKKHRDKKRKKSPVVSPYENRVTGYLRWQVAAICDGCKRLVLSNLVEFCPTCGSVSGMYAAIPVPPFVIEPLPL